jgi:hypothetical protein
MTTLPESPLEPHRERKDKPKKAKRTSSSCLPVTTDAAPVIAKECAVKPLAPLSIVNWAWDTKTYTIPFPLPLCNDSLPVLEKKLGLLRNVVESAESLARATGWQAADSKDDLAYQWVRKNLTPSEFSRYVAWKEGIPPPAVDWSKAMDDDGKPEYQARPCFITALAILYPEQTITDREAVWFVTTYPDDLPLLTAITQVQEADLLFINDEALWIGPEQAEAQTAKRIVATATASLEAARHESEALVRSIKRSIRFISTREGVLEGKVIEFEKRMRAGMTDRNAV